uniref:Uncharacterized protein n=2 Tax=Physcomitrium patens TaxID=3218 RepID=A0A7I4F584_PHYPA
MRLPWGEAFPHRPALSTTQVSSVFKRVHMSTMSSSSASKRPEITRGQSAHHRGVANKWIVCSRHCLGPHVPLRVLNQC